ncbi:MAG TPA: hypothetical protein VLH81_08400, partial [Desulfobacterales bacterium]|nr:hypothetical protein [Desulfobacterales bacterium]
AIEVLGLSFPYRKRWFFLEQIGGERVFLEAMPWGDIALTAQQVKTATVPRAWLQRIGSYTAVNTATGDVEMIRDVEIATKGDFLVLRYGFNPLFGDAPAAEFGLRVIDSHEARIMGLGRGAGEGVHAVTAADGSEHLFYFGLELERR